MKEAQTMRLKVLAGFFVLAAAVLSNGCGGSSTTTSTTVAGASGATGAQGAALTKSQFLAKANAICKKGNQAVQSAGQQQFPKSGGKPSSSELQAFATKTVIPNIQEQITAIKALPAPSGDQAKVTQIVDAAQAALNKAKANPSSITGNGPGPFKKTNTLARAYGLTTCAGGGG
jgi:hypothetical protein